MNQPVLTLFFTLSSILLSAQNWQPMAQGLLPKDYLITGISAVGEHVIWAVAIGNSGGPPVSSSHISRLLRSSDGGEHWTVSNIEEAAGKVSFQIVALDSMHAWITSQDYNGGQTLYKTVDGGETWTPQISNLACGVMLNRFADGLHWLAQNQQYVARSPSNGATWEVATIPGYEPGEGQYLNAATNMSCTMGDTLWSGTSNGRIVRCTDFGQTSEFITTELGNAAIIFPISFENHLKGLCYSLGIGNNHQISKSKDGGTTWTVLPQQPGSMGWNICAIPGLPGAYVLASNYQHAAGKVAITTDFGNTWSVETIGQSLNAVMFSSPSTGWISAGKITADNQPAIFKYTGSPLVSTENAAELPDFRLYPNPATDLLYFDFQGLNNMAAVQASLTDLAGRCVYTGTVTDQQLNMQHVPAGMYVLKISTEEGMAVRKVIRFFSE